MLTPDRQEQTSGEHSSGDGQQLSGCRDTAAAMRRSPGRHRLHPLCWLLLPLWLAGVSILGLSTTSRAHGGVIIDTGFTEHYEWLVSVDPFPTLLGEAMITLLIYDIVTYEPMDDFTVALYQAAPDSTVPCCQPEHHGGPVALTIDPALYPGDYSSLITLDQPGEWQLQFVATAPQERVAQSFEVTVTLTVNANMGGSRRIAMGSEGSDADATATAFAQSVTDARQQSSPLAAPVSPLVDSSSVTTDTAIDTAAESPLPTARDSSLPWLLWGGLALLPILLIGWLTLRAGK